MKSIEVAVLNPEVIPSAEKMMVCAARLTQRGHKIKAWTTSWRSITRATPRTR